MFLRFACVVLAGLVACGCKKPEPTYCCSPLFSESGFSHVREGMSEDEVRDLIGNPVGRFGPVTSSSGVRVDWQYSVPLNDAEPIRFRQFTVSFGADDLVQRTMAVDSMLESDEGVLDWIGAVKHCRREVGDLVFRDVDGGTQQLLAKDEGIHVILLVSDCRAGSCRLNPGPEWFRDAVGGLLETNRIASVKHFYIGKNQAVYRKLVASLSPVKSGECFLEAEPDLKLSVFDQDSCMLFYQAGVLWSVTPADGFPNGELGAKDQEWLLHRLADGKVS